MITYNEKHQKIIESGIDEIRKTLFGNDDNLIRELLFCLDFYLDPYYKNQLSYEKEIYDLLQELAVTSNNEDIINWTVTHDGDLVIIELDDGTKETVNIEDYKKEVFKFADVIEDFYNSCTPKELPGTDDLEYRNGWIAFWNEWHRRRGNRTI